MFLKCSDIMSDQVHAWTDIGQDTSDMKTFRSLCSQSFQFFSIIEHIISCITWLFVEVDLYGYYVGARERLHENFITVMP